MQRFLVSAHGYGPAFNIVYVCFNAASALWGQKYSGWPFAGKQPEMWGIWLQVRGVVSKFCAVQLFVVLFSSYVS